MVSPEEAVMAMDPATRHITPTEYEGVKLVSFGFAGQGSAIMRGAMVSGEPRGSPLSASQQSCHHQSEAYQSQQACRPYRAAAYHL